MSSKERQEQTLAYVFAPLDALSDNTHAIAGVIDCGAQRPYFRYGRSWLENPEAYALDPINLPLGNDPIYCNNRLGVHPVFSDAGPDSWGTKVLLRGHTTVPKNEVERLLATSGSGVGGLRFSLSRTKFKKPPPLPTEDQLAVLEFASEKVEAGVTISNELLQLLAPCSSMGGARPKITYVDSNGKPWLAKFTKPNDLLNMPRVEAACLNLAEQLGFDVSEHKVIKLGVVLQTRVT